MKLIFAFACLCAASLAFAVEVDGIAAKVNDAVILKSDVVNELKQMGGDASQFTEVRNDMIDRKLILKAAVDAKMTMQEWVIDNRIREIISRVFKGDRNLLLDALAKQKMSYPEWRERMKDDMIVGAMRWQVVDKNVTASPAELRAEYKAHPERYRTGDQVTVSVILLKPEDAVKRDAVDAALKTNDFAAVAKEYSSDVNASQGGVWKDVDPEDSFRPEVCEAIDKMAKGEVSQWIDLDGWSFLVRKDEESESKAKTFAEAFDDIEANVKEEKAKKLYTDWIERLRAAAYIKVF